MADRADKIKKGVMVFLLLLLAGYWISRLLSEPAPAPAPKQAARKAVKKAARKGKHKRGGAPSDMFPTVDVSRLDSLNVPVKITRNIFDPLYRPPVVKPLPVAPVQPVKPVGTPTGNISKPPPPPPPSREEIEAKKAADELNQFSFTGFVSRRDRLDILLTHRKGMVIANPGEDIDLGEEYSAYQFYVKEVRPDALVIADRAHWLHGKEVETTIPADFEGKNIDVITNASAPYVGAGARGGTSGPSGGAAQPARGQQPQPGNRRPSGPSGGRRAPAEPPRVVGVPVVVGGPATTASGKNNVSGEEEVPGGGEEEPVVDDTRDGTVDDTGAGAVDATEEPSGTEFPPPLDGHTL